MASTKQRLLNRFIQQADKMESSTTTATAFLEVMIFILSANAATPQEMENT